jgi:nucleotide-binding universal stress UspA family protein
MYRKILLAYHGPAYTARALEHATALARAFDAELHLLGIVTTAIGLELAEAGGTMEGLALEKSRLETAVSGQAQRLRDLGHRVTVSLCDGDPAVDIVTTACRIEADLVVMASSDKAAMARWFQSDLGSKMLSHIPCSVLLP